MTPSASPPRVAIAILSLILLIPCFWQRRIQAGDLASHVYNCWLAQQIEMGKAPGLTIAPMTTNVLFDWILYRLYRGFGPEPAQRIAVSIAVLIFFWSAFAFVWSVSGARPWFLTPCLLMLTYGWTFHMGFFNFYLAVGLSLCALTLSLKRGIVCRVAAGALLALAYTANGIAPAWAVCAIVYTWAARRLSWRNRIVLFGLGCCGIAGLRFGIASRYHASSSFHQFLESGGVDQVWVFGIKYWTISVALALLWGFLLLRLSHIKGFVGSARGISLQLCALTAIGILLLPSSLELPQYRIAISFITERITLLYGVLICASLAAADPPAWLRISFVPLAVVYFVLLFADTSAINRIESRMEALTTGLSVNDRVFSSLEDPNSRVQLWGHNLDRVCLGKCVSYANYEPFTQAFRIRAVRNNGLVVANPLDYAALQAGGYVVRPGDLPFYQITLCDGQSAEICLKRLNAGDVTRHDLLPLAW